MTREERTVAVLEEVEEMLKLLKEDLSGDNFEEYADTCEDAHSRITNLIYILTHKEET